MVLLRLKIATQSGSMDIVGSLGEMAEDSLPNSVRTHIDTEALFLSIPVAVDLFSSRMLGWL